MKPFMNDLSISSSTWQGFERLVCRLLVVEGLDFARTIGESGDGGADVLAIRGRRRWLVQVKRWANPAGVEVLERTIAAARTYGADVPAVASKAGFTGEALTRRIALAREGINVQLWDGASLVRRAERIDPRPLAVREPERYRLREYQRSAVEVIVQEWLREPHRSVLAVLATGLGKTFVAAEVLRRCRTLSAVRLKVLVLAHTNDLVYQLERAFWPFMAIAESSVIANGIECPAWSDLALSDCVFASRDRLISAVRSQVDLPRFDVVLVDECHHLGSSRYEEILDYLGVGTESGPFLMGLTATPWRPTGEALDHRFDGAAVSIDLVWGLRHGFLSNVDYRIFTDNVDWDRLRTLHGDRFTPRAINKTLFIPEWDDAVLERIEEVWAELGLNARGIVFCGTVEHAKRVANRINALGFARAEPIFGSVRGSRMSPIERNRLLLDFADGRIGLLCAVDVLNEGIDVPDVNLIVFQRVTHSRRIFVQQLGRGLRVASGKDRVVVLDFVSDVRRFAAGLELKRALDQPSGGDAGRPARVRLGSQVRFLRHSRSDTAAENFLAEWLGDISAVEDAGEDASVLRFPPRIPADLRERMGDK